MRETGRGWTPELRATFYYFTAFMTSGAATAYGGIWFQDQGLSSGEIGLIGSVPVFIMTTTTTAAMTPMTRTAIPIASALRRQ